MPDAVVALQRGIQRLSLHFASKSTLLASTARLRDRLLPEFAAQGVVLQGDDTAPDLGLDLQLHLGLLVDHGLATVF